ncbi:MAG: rubredoxin [Opitutales bacterium]|nr:rubredoxin [Opitutales bacterium]
MTYTCTVCGYKYDESAEKTLFKDLPCDWLCPLCGAPKEMFEPEKQNAGPDNRHTAAEILINTLQENGLRFVFGMVGHSNLGLADAIRKNVSQNKMEFFGIRHESSAAFAASAYGKLAGKPAACLSIAGPGATNLLTGLCDADLDRSPAIAIMGQVPTGELDLGIFQELNLASIFESTAKNQYTLFENSDFAKTASEAYANSIAKGGVSQIIVPDDVQTAAATPSHIFKKTQCAPCAPNQDSLDEACRMIEKSSRPSILLGFGAKDAAKECLLLANILNAPIFTTYRAKGFIDENGELSCGVLGRSGTPISMHFAEKSDLIIAVGCGFSKHTGLSKTVPVIQIDNDASAFGKRRKADCPILSDAKLAISALFAMMKEKAVKKQDFRAEIKSLRESWISEKSKRAAKNEKNAISPAFVCQVLSRKIPEKSIISVDVGNVAYSFGRYFEAKSQRILLSFYLGSIGVGLPAAMGAYCATKEDGEFKNSNVFAVVGDGGFAQYLADWTTVSKYKMPIKCVVFNNSELAKISLEQANARFDVWSTSLKNPNFAEFAASCGTLGIRVSEACELEGAIEKAMQFDGPALIEVMTNPNLS